MSSTFANPPGAAAPMRGPDFVLETVRSWTEGPGRAGALVLDDGSHWLLDAQRADLDVQKVFILRAMQGGQALFVSGDRATGFVDRVASARKLAAQRVEMAPDGRYSVLFAGPPSIYHLRLDRPEAARSLQLLQRSAAQARLPDDPDLLVGIDTVTSDFVLVQPWPRPTR